MILDDPLQIDRSLFCGHKICVDLAHILYTAQSVQYVYNNIYNSVDKWLIIDVYFILSLYMYNLYIYICTYPPYIHFCPRYRRGTSKWKLLPLPRARNDTLLPRSWKSLAPFKRVESTGEDDKDQFTILFCLHCLPYFTCLPFFCMFFLPQANINELMHVTWYKCRVNHCVQELGLRGPEIEVGASSNGRSLICMLVIC